MNTFLKELEIRLLDKKNIFINTDKVIFHIQRVATEQISWFMSLIYLMGNLLWKEADMF